MTATGKGAANEEKLYRMSFASAYPAYPAYVSKAERKARSLDKLVDELAKGKAMEKILRQ